MMQSQTMWWFWITSGGKYCWCPDSREISLCRPFCGHRNVVGFLSDVSVLTKNFCYMGRQYVQSLCSNVPLPTVSNFNDQCRVTIVPVFRLQAIATLYVHQKFANSSQRTTHITHYHHQCPCAGFHGFQSLEKALSFQETSLFQTWKWYGKPTEFSWWSGNSGILLVLWWSCNAKVPQFMRDKNGKGTVWAREHKHSLENIPCVSGFKTAFYWWIPDLYWDLHKLFPSIMCWFDIIFYVDYRLRQMFWVGRGRWGGMKMPWKSIEFFCMVLSW